MYEHLKKYHECFPKYGDLLTKSEALTIKREQIREFVAQDDVAGERVFYNFLAVKEVRIYCEFPNSDVGKIMLIDMPGLGDTGYGDEERLIATLGKEVDFVLFVRMPKVVRGVWEDVDVKLYDVANNALKSDLPIEEWSFMVLNNTSSDFSGGDNTTSAKSMRDDIAKQHIAVAKCLLANCANKDDVQKVVLDQTLEYLTANIKRLDKRYAEGRQNALFEIIKKCHLVVSNAKELIPQAALNSDWFAVFQEKFQAVYETLSKELFNFVIESRTYIDEPNEEFDNGVKETLRDLEETPLAPDRDKIKTLQALHGGIVSGYNAALNFSRAAISERFLNMDNYLGKAVERIQIKLAEILAKKCLLGKAFPGSPQEFLFNFNSFLKDGDKEVAKIAVAIQALVNFRLSYREFLHPKVRRCLDILDPKSQQHNSIGQPPQGSAQEIEDAIDIAEDALMEGYKQTMYKLGESLCQFSPDVNMALFALVEEFEDRVLRAENMEIEWQYLYQRFKGDIWSEEFNQLEENSQLRSSLEAEIKSILATVSEIDTKFTE